MMRNDLPGEEAKQLPYPCPASPPLCPQLLDGGISRCVFLPSKWVRETSSSMRQMGGQGTDPELQISKAAPCPCPGDQGTPPPPSPSSRLLGHGHCCISTSPYWDSYHPRWAA